MTQKRLAPHQWFGRAKPALDQVFRQFDFKQTVFTDAASVRLILDTNDDYFLSREQFRAACVAAQHVGDTSYFFSVVRGYISRAEDMPYRTWELPLFDYDAYVTAEDIGFAERDDVVVPDRIEKDIALDRLLYSPAGEWGILTVELIALVGGSAAFVTRFGEEYPRWERDTELFLEKMREAALKRNVDASWVQPLLGHIYGRGAPRFELSR